MSRLWGGIGLILLAFFMSVGFLGANVGGAAAVLALGIAVVLPGAVGASMIAGHFRGKAGALSRKDDLRRQTMESELLRLAGKRGGRLTIIEAVSELGLSPEQAKESLDALSLRGMADFEVTDSGVVVYSFHDLRHLSEKSEAKGILE